MIVTESMNSTKEVALKILLAFRASFNFVLIIPIETLFFLENGLSFTQIFLLQSIWSLIVLLTEFPCGHFADQFGRRKSIIVGCLFSLCGYILLSTGTNFWLFALCQIFLATGRSFVIGADVSLLYDLLVERNRKSDYLKYESLSTSLNYLSKAIAQFIVFFLIINSYRIALYIQVLIAIIVLCFAFLLIDQKQNDNIERYSLLQTISHIRKFLVKQPSIIWVILFRAIMLNMTFIITLAMQPLLFGSGFGMTESGLIWVTSSLLVAFSAQIALRYISFFEIQQFLMLLLVLGIFAYFSLGLYSSLLIPGLFLLSIVRGASKPILFDIVNVRLKSSHRATMLSIDSIIRRFMYAIICPVIGLFIDNHSLTDGMLFSTLLFGIPGALILLRLQYELKKKH